MFIEKLGPEEALSTFFTFEFVIGLMSTFMFNEVWLSGESVVTDGALVGFYSTVCDDVCLQFVRPVELFGTTCSQEETQKRKNVSKYIYLANK